jgi:hypothetical protein
MTTKPSTPATPHVDIAPLTEARLQAESDARFLLGDYDDNFDDCEGAWSVPSTAENVTERLAIFEKHGFK